MWGAHLLLFVIEGSPIAGLWGGAARREGLGLFCCHCALSGKRQASAIKHAGRSQLIQQECAKAGAAF